MERKHQVFVSSTYKDLVDERKEVIHALLELDCIPAGMELFPATDEDAWSLIKEIIDGCDYYLLIVAGKYGSVNKDGISYTEMEYDYAVSIEKPIINFIHENIGELPANKVESSDIGKENLLRFHTKVKQKHCKFWTGSPDLGGKASRSLIQLKKKHPSPGWVPGIYAADSVMLNQMEKMRTEIANLKMKAFSNDNAPPQNIDDLKHGEDTYSVECSLTDEKGVKKPIDLEASWDDIFSYCGPALAGECTESDLLSKVQLVYWHSIPSKFKGSNKYSDIIIPYVVQDQIYVQLQALNLMISGSKKRPVSDKETYWKLTPYGEKYLIQVRALRSD